MLWDGIRNKNIERGADWKSEVVVTQWTPEQIKEHFSKGGEKMSETKKISKEVYLDLKDQGWNDKKIIKEYEINHNILYRLKKQWNIVGMFGPGKNVVKPQEEKDRVVKAISEPTAEDNDQIEHLKKQLEEERIQSEALQQELNRLRNDYEALEHEKENNKEFISNESYDQMESAWIQASNELKEMHQICEEQDREINRLNKAAEAWRNRYQVTVEALKVHI